MTTAFLREVSRTAWVTNPGLRDSSDTSQLRAPGSERCLLWARKVHLAVSARGDSHNRFPNKVSSLRCETALTTAGHFFPSHGFACWLPGYSISQGVIVKCHVAEACVGGLHSLCGDGYSGRHCGQCAVGYYMMSSHCRQCSSNASAVTLLVVLAAIGVLVIAFFEWQAMKDPRIGSPFVLIMRLLETLGIFSLCVARWPGSVSVLLSITALVNMNTEVFQTECLLGRAHPTRAVLVYVCGIPAFLLALLLFYPFLQLLRHCTHFDRGASLSLESMCEPLMPGKVAGELLGTRLHFTPMQALIAATFKEYIKIAFTVPLCACLLVIRP
jgi:hypothetical protein